MPQRARVAPPAFHNNTKARLGVAGKAMVNISKVIVISDIVLRAAVASVQCIFQKRFTTHRRQCKWQCGTGNSRRIERNTNYDQNFDYRGGFSEGLDV
jgi:hypothetical protein